ncbi:MAG: efflux RND transporter periplasmic adaptor subunit [Candidatus Manganitrophaceae bacterium]
MDQHRKGKGTVLKGGLLTLVATTVLLGLYYFYPSDGHQNGTVTRPMAASSPGLENGTATRQTTTTGPASVAAQGKVETLPGLHVKVSSEIAARVARSFFKEGDSVEKGALLAQLENRDIEAKLKEAETELAVAKAKQKEIAAGSRREEIDRATARLAATLSEKNLAESNVVRYRQLFEEGMVTKAGLDEKETALQTAAARVREAEEEKHLLEEGPRKETLALQEETVRRAEATVQYYRELLKKTILHAPISGKITRKYIEEGEMSDPDKTPMLAIADPGQIRVNAEIDETDIGKIGLGDPAEITSDAYPGKVFKGKIEEISDEVGAREVRPNDPAVNLGIKVIQVKIALLEKTPLKIGMTVDVKIRSERNR